MFCGLMLSWGVLALNVLVVRMLIIYLTLMRLDWLSTLAMFLIVAQAQLDCAAGVPHGVSNIDTLSCNCETGYDWDELNCAINCTRVPNSNGNGVSVTECECNLDYAWVDGGCASTAVNCTEISNATSQDGLSACHCQAGYIWSASTRSCIIDCTVRANSNGSNEEPMSCYCNAGFYWDWTTNTCLQDPIDCASFEGASGSDNLGGCLCT